MMQDYKRVFKLFGIIPALRVRKSAHRFEIRLLCFIPFVKLSKKGRRRMIILFGFLPLARWRAGAKVASMPEMIKSLTTAVAENKTALKKLDNYNTRAGMSRFLELPARRNSVLVLDFTNGHLEVLASVVHYFLELGYNVDIGLTPENIANDGIDCFNFPTDRVRVVSVDEKTRYSPLFTRGFLRYDWIFLNTSDVYSAKEHNAVDYVKKYCWQYYKNNLYFITHGNSEWREKIPPKIARELLPFDWKIHRFPIYGHISNYLSPTWFAPVAKDSPKNKTTRFFIAGGIQNKNKERRDHNILFDALMRNGNLRVVVIGRRENQSESLVIPDELKETLDFCGTLTYRQMYQELNKSDFILSGCNADNPVQNYEYLKNCASGNYGLSIGFSKPLVIPTEYAKAAGLDASTAIVYDGERETLADAIGRAIKMTPAEYASMTKNISELRARLQSETMDNFRRVFGEAK
ncbi:MAG: hypothetical protein LBL46_02270 [Rickettsiales bacterium]|nr:hypothetical protein [Rickettsiales bacterium]